MNIKKLFGKKKDEEKLKAFQQAAGYSGSATTQPAAERQLTSDVTFAPTKCEVSYLLSTDQGERGISSFGEVENALLDMMAGEAEFVILTVGNACHGIRFIQSCPLNDEDGFTVELALEQEGGRTRLVEKSFYTQKECLEVFREFYNTSSVQDKESYTPVEFYK